MFAPDKQWVAAFTRACRTVMHRCEMAPNSCVETACIGVGVARDFGYLAEPVPVAVDVIAADQREATVLPGPGGSRRGGNFAGHLVLHFAGDHFVDLTADQFHAPRRGMYVPGPVRLAGVSRELLAGGFELGLSTGTVIRYVEMAGDVSWKALPAWWGSSALTTRLAVTELRDLLAEKTRG